jgi:hypothetical protein
MRIIADGYTDLLKGREKILGLQKRYADDWGEKISALKDIFAGIYKTEDQEILDQWHEENKKVEDKWRSKINTNKTAITVLGILLLGGSAVFVRFLFSPSEFVLEFISVLAVCFGFPAFLLFVGLAFALMLMIVHNQSLIRRGPKTTRKPYIRPRQFFVDSWLDLESGWWFKLSMSPAPIEQEYGDIGEKELVTKLAQRLPDDHYCIKKLMVGNHLDADVVVVGPSGIWILESKYINGTIRVRNGSWSKGKAYFGEGGVPQIEEVEFESFEEQWLREKRAVQRAIKGILPDHAGVNNGLIKGGLAFTHPKTRLDFDYSLNVEFKNADQWAEEICAASENGILTDEQVVQLADTLLSYSSKKGNTIYQSAVDVAEIEYKQKVARLENVLKDNGLIELSPREKRLRDSVRAFEENQEQKEYLWGS